MTRDTLDQRLGRLDQSEEEQFLNAMVNARTPLDTPKAPTNIERARTYLQDLQDEGRVYDEENRERLTQMFKKHLFPTLRESLQSRLDSGHPLPQKYHEQTTDREHYALEGGWHAICLPEGLEQQTFNPSKYDHAPIEEVAAVLMKRGVEFWKDQNEKLGYKGSFNPRLGHSKKDIEKLTERFDFRQTLRNERNPEQLAHTLRLIKSSEHEHFPLISRIKNTAKALNISNHRVDYINREFGPEIGEYFK